MNGFSHLVKLVTLLCLLTSVSVVEGQVEQISGLIAGYPVIATYNWEEVRCMQPNTTRVTLQATQSSPQDFLAEINVAEVMSALQPFQGSRRLLVEFSGPGGDPARSRSGLERWNETFRTMPCPQLTANDGDEGVGTSPNGIAENENMDPVLAGTNDNAQSVILKGPSAIGSPPAPVAFLNNVTTDTIYFLQNGLVFGGGQGYIVWTSFAQNLNPQFYDTNIISYDGSHEYWFTISYTNSVWWLCAQDLTTWGYACAVEWAATGTNLSQHISTAVWIENLNTDLLWWTGFTDVWYARRADVFINGFAQPWTSDHRHTLHHCGSSYPPSNAVLGSLVNHQTVQYYLPAVPPRCE